MRAAGASLGGEIQVNDEALCAIMSEWTLFDLGYQERIDRLTGMAEGGLNGEYLLNASAVGHDTSADVLTGSAGLDWFLFDAQRDRATDLHDEAFANDADFISSP
jgi:hypothetical protein